MEEDINETMEALARIQNIDVSQLKRTDLGPLNFSDAQKSIIRVLGLYKKIPTEVVADLSLKSRQKLLQSANAFWNQLSEVEKFSIDQDNPNNARKSIISNIEGYYDRVFDEIFPIISFSVARDADFAELETRARASIQSIDDKSATLVAQLETANETSERIIAEMRSATAEAGVAKQAHFFMKEAEYHAEQSDKWRNTSQKWVFVLIGFGVLSLLTFKISWLQPENVSQAIQYVSAKLIVLFGLGYIVVSSYRVYFSHRHNFIINKHRQNALLTFKALAEAGNTPEARDIVLSRAASSIFDPQDTGYSKGGANPSIINSIADSLPRANMRVDGSMTS